MTLEGRKLTTNLERVRMNALQCQRGIWVYVTRRGRSMAVAADQIADITRAASWKTYKNITDIHN